MAYKTIISDWNGTLFKYPTDEIQNRKIAFSVASNSIKQALLHGRIWKVGSIVKLLRIKSKLENKLQEYYKGEKHLRDVYGFFNENILKGRSVSFVNSIINEYARNSVDKIDRRIMGPVEAVHKNGKSTAILSVSYDYSIRKILEEAGFSNVFDDIIANTIQADNDIAVGLTFEIYEKKPEVLKSEFSEKRGLKENEILYFGDSEDDELVADVLAPGNFIVPFFASDDFKQKLSSKHKAFVPESEKELLKYLQDR